MAGRLKPDTGPMAIRPVEHLTSAIFKIPRKHPKGAANSCSQPTRSFPASYSNRVTGNYYTILQKMLCIFFFFASLTFWHFLEYKRHNMFVILQYLEFYFRFRFGEIK